MRSLRKAQTSVIGTEKIEAQETTEILKKLIFFLNNTFTKHNSYWNIPFKNVAFQEQTTLSTSEPVHTTKGQTATEKYLKRKWME